jgi:hypothetical protein
MSEELISYREKYNAVKNKLDIAMGLLEGMTIIPVDRNNNSYTSRAAKVCKCDGKTKPQIEQSAYVEGKWIAQCQKCGCRTTEQSTPVRAVKAWNREELTECSIMCREKLTITNINLNGLINLITAISDISVDDLMWAEKHDTLDSKTAEEARRWIRNAKVIKDIESGDRRKREEFERMMAKLNAKINHVTNVL